MALSETERGGLLLLEDDPGICELEAQRLEPLGLPIRRAHSSGEGRAALTAGPSPELMLVDYSLPGQTALEFIEGLKTSGVAVPPFMVVTGRGDEAVAVASMKAGACDYLVKNADFLDSLLPTVRKALERTELQRQLEAARESTAKNLHLYTFLAQVNLAAARTRDRRQLYREICDIAVSAGMRMAWIGVPDRDLGRITPFCWSGAEDGYLDGIKIYTSSDISEGKGPTGMAASTRTIRPCADIARDPMMEPWREKALARGYRSSAAIPLEEGGRLSAVLTIYSGESGFFSGDELKLLEEIKADISLALEAISTEERRAYAQASLERTAADLAHIMDVTPVMLFRLRLPVSEEAALEWVSGNAGALTGYSPEEALKPGWIKENMHPDDRAASADLSGIVSSKNLVRDFRFRRKDGEYFWVHSQLKLSKEYAGEITGSWTDITPLKESETRFQELFEKAPIGYLSTDERGGLLAVNDTWCEVFGRERAGAIGVPLRGMLVPESLAGFDEWFGRLVAEGDAGSFEPEIARPDGTRRWLSFSARAARDKAGAFQRTHCIFSDITRERAQRRQMRLLNDAVGASFDEIYIFGPDDFRFVFLNQAAYKNLGYTEEEAGRLTPWDIKHEFTESSFRRAVAPLLNGEKSLLLLESVHTRKDGSSYPVEVRLQLVESGEGRFFLSVVKDITERRKNDVLLAEMANLQRVESLGALAGGIAHDFNNMLTGIMANLSLLAARPGGAGNEIIHEALEAARAAKSLTSQLLAFSKGGKPLKKEFSLVRSLKEIFSLATRGSAAAKRLAVPEGLWSMDGDESQIKQAVNNLLVNALQAMPDGGRISLSAENAELSGGGALPPGKYVRITVEDTGIGIPAEYLSHIFEPYFTTKARGHGLGLSMTWFVIKNHGGNVEVSSEPGKGTRFVICLPATGRPAPAAAPPARPAVKGSGRVLLLEDEDIVVKAALRMLGELGYSAEVVPDGKAALALYQKELAAGRPFDAVIMDLTIPGGMGGKEAGTRLRQLHPEAVIIVSSGYSDEPVMADFKSFGFDAVLPKPYRYEDLSETLAKLIGKG
jgi:PAS domain S-box-containing protein